MNQHMHKLLTTLERAQQDGGEGWVLSAKYLHSIPYHVRQLAQVKGCVEGRGTTSNREYRILPDGQQVLADYNAKTGSAEPQRAFSNLDIKTMPDVEPAAPLKSFVGLDSLITPNQKPAVIPTNMREFAQSANGYPAPTLLENSQKNNSHRDPRAQACVQAIDILSKDWPEVNDLVGVLMKLNRMRERKAQADE